MLSFIQFLEEDWQKVNRRDKTDGLSKSAVAAYRRENPYCCGATEEMIQSFRDYNLNEGLLDWLGFGSKKPPHIHASWHPREGEDKNMYYHVGKSGGIKKFHPFTHFGTSRAARARIYDMNAVPEHRQKPFNHYTVRLKLKKGLEIKDEGIHHEPQDYMLAMAQQKHITSMEYTDWQRKIIGLKHKDQFPLVADVMKSKGFDHAYYTNKIDHPGSKSIVITDPSQVRVVREGRSRFNQTRMKADSARDTFKPSWKF